MTTVLAAVVLLLLLCTSFRLLQHSIRILVDGMLALWSTWSLWLVLIVFVVCCNWFWVVAEQPITNNTTHSLWFLFLLIFLHTITVPGCCNYFGVVIEPLIIQNRTHYVWYFVVVHLFLLFTSFLLLWHSIRILVIGTLALWPTWATW